MTKGFKEQTTLGPKSTRSNVVVLSSLKQKSHPNYFGLLLTLLSFITSVSLFAIYYLLHSLTLSYKHSISLSLKNSLSLPRHK